MTLAESELIGLAPLAAFLDAADHAGCDADAPVEERLAAAARHQAARLQPAHGPRTPSRRRPAGRS
ncbi:MAG: hypothetical protein U0838_15480 [Chloroflexota bacterium]